MEEAARGETAAPPPVEEPPPPRRDPIAERFARAATLMDFHIAIDKQRREAALREARARGLDAASPTPIRPPPRPRVSRTRMNPYVHARLLIRDTKLSLQEIVDITGLDIYQVAAMKLKMRDAA